MLLKLKEKSSNFGNTSLSAFSFGFETMQVLVGLRSWNNVVSDTFNRFELPLVLRAPEAIYDRVVNLLHRKEHQGNRNQLKLYHPPKRKSFI